MQSRRTLTPNQIVSQNLRRARKAKGWSMQDAATKLAPYIKGKAWSAATFRAAEGTRSRAFDANDLVGLALAFGVSVEFFQELPADVDVVLPSGVPVSRESYIDIVSQRAERPPELTPPFRETHSLGTTSDQTTTSAGAFRQQTAAKKGRAK